MLYTLVCAFHCDDAWSLFYHRDTGDSLLRSCSRFQQGKVVGIFYNFNMNCFCIHSLHTLRLNTCLIASTYSYSLQFIPPLLHVLICFAHCQLISINNACVLSDIAFNTHSQDCSSCPHWTTQELRQEELSSQ